MRLRQAESYWLDQLIQYEEGELDEEDMLELFGHLVQTGLAWTLQGHYGRNAARLIELGYLDNQGNVLKVGHHRAKGAK